MKTNKTVLVLGMMALIAVFSAQNAQAAQKPVRRPIVKPTPSLLNPGNGRAPLLGGNSGAPLIRPGSANGVIAQGGGNVIAQGGGNVIAQGGGNLVGRRN